eukprot:366512-Chlamydomonas_euryale.AAC.26
MPGAEEVACCARLRRCACSCDRRVRGPVAARRSSTSRGAQLHSRWPREAVRKRKARSTVPALICVGCVAYGHTCRIPEIRLFEIRDSHASGTRLARSRRWQPCGLRHDHRRCGRGVTLSDGHRIAGYGPKAKPTLTDMAEERCQDPLADPTASQ